MMKNKQHLQTDVYGECIYVDPYVFVQIPKNASSWMRNLLGDNITGSNHTNIFKHNFFDKNFVVILRDPVDRWISGASELLYARNNIGYSLDNFVDYAFEHVCLDEHTDLQINFLETVPLHNTTWFYFNDFLEKNFLHWANKQRIKINRVPKKFKNYSNDATLWFCPGNALIRETTQRTPDLLPGFSRKQISHALRIKLESDHKLVKKVQNFYQTDYELIKNCNFQKSI